MLALLFAVASALPRYWSVHIDAPAQRVEYQRIGREQATIRHEILKAHKIDPPAVFSISTADGKFMSFRPRKTMSEFDTPSSIPEEVRAEIQKKAGPLDDAIHRTITEHHNEIWELQRVATRVDSRRAPKYIRFRTDYVKPGNDKAYEAAMKRLAEMFAAESAKLEGQWDRGDNVSTEDLRLALRRYRSFFGRLLSV